MAVDYMLMWSCAHLLLCGLHISCVDDPELRFPMTEAEPDMMLFLD
jgi:hypothetical protein